MQSFSRQIQMRWADIDQNRHLRHSAYYDFGAMIRIEFLCMHGLSPTKMEELRIGPILFREEAIFRHEIKFEDSITIDFQLVKATPDFCRWSLRHHLTKSDGKLAAIVALDGAWIDLDKRKLATPNAFVQQVFDTIPKSPDYRTIHKSLTAEAEMGQN